MRWANPPVAWMMHAGIGRMLAAGMAFPAHDLPRRVRGRARIALEAYPAFTARRAYRGSYKSDTPAKQTADRRTGRLAILRAIEAGTVGLDITAEIPIAWRRRIVADGAGDLLDAVICGLQAGHAWSAPRLGLPADLDPLEGWIAAVPWSRGGRPTPVVTSRP
jgi:predicted RNase H-like nuclease